MLPVAALKSRITPGIVVTSKQRFPTLHCRGLYDSNLHKTAIPLKSVAKNSFDQRIRWRGFSNTSNRNAIHIAIIGSGPSGFYSAKYLLDSNDSIHIDMFERLPTPYGLVRYGVAPDHQAVKSVMTQFADIAKSKRFRYFGNVCINGEDPTKDISLITLREKYDGVLLAYGASSDTPMNIPGENLRGILSARCFVNWYNGHPDYQYLNEYINLHKTKHIVIIGNGNVAIDCARVLSKDPISELSSTDIMENALDKLKNSSIETITLIGRRGHVQASFTIKEFRELTKLRGVRVHIDPNELALGMTAASQTELNESRAKQRICELISNTAKTSHGAVSNEHSKVINMRFLLSPIAFLPSNPNDRPEEGLKTKEQVQGILVQRNCLIGEANRQNISPSQDNPPFVIPCDLVLKSVGFRCVPMEGAPFDYTRYVIPSNQGRVVDSNKEPIPGLYVTGWLKRGPTGIIGTNIPDAKETVGSIIEDMTNKIDSFTEKPKEDPILTTPQLNSPSVVSWDSYLRLENIEQRLGAESSPSRIRIKTASIEQMLKYTKQTDSSKLN